MEWGELYSYIPPPGKNIPISVQPFLVDDSVPTEDQIEWAVKHLRNNRSGGELGMRTEHLKQWLTKAWKAAKYRETAAGKEEEAAATTARARSGMSEAQKGTDLESENWTRDVDLIQLAFW